MLHFCGRSLRAANSSPTLAPIYRVCGGIAKRRKLMTIDEIIDNFSLLDEWDDRYRYVIELGRTLAPLPSATAPTPTRCRAARARSGSRHDGAAERPRRSGAQLRRRQRRPYRARADRDPLRPLFRQAARRRSLRRDAVDLFNRLGLREHLTPQRSNGFRSMVERIRQRRPHRAGHGGVIHSPTAKPASGASHVRTGARFLPRASAP